MKILVVDEDILFARLVKTKLEAGGHTVTLLNTGGDALKRIDKEPYRIVIVSTNLPDVNGLDICRRVRQLSRDRYIYVLVYGHEGSKEEMIGCLEAGADDFLSKPFHPVELRFRLNNAKRLLDLEDELREGGGVDPVTELVNYESFRQFFAVVLAEAQRSNTVGALMFVEVPDFNAIFDDQGYVPAQTMMAEVGRILGRSVRRSDLICRYGSDLFCVLLQSTYWDKCLPTAHRFAERIENSVVYIDDCEIRPRISIATANYPVPGVPAEDILSHAERVPFKR